MCQRNTDEILFGDRTDCTHETQHLKRKDIEKKMIEKVLNNQTITAPYGIKSKNYIASSGNPETVFQIDDNLIFDELKTALNTR